MVRKIVTATASAALCLSSVTPAFAQNYAFSGFDAPRGATATVNFKVPLDAAREKAKPTYGLTFGYGQTVGSPNMDGRTISRGMQFADFRFDGQKMSKAQVMSFDLANLDKDRRLNMFDEGEGNSAWIIIGIVAAGVAICLLADCFDGDDDDDDDDTSD